MRACRCGDSGTDACREHCSAPGNLVAEAGHHRRAGEILGGHRDDVERYRDTDGCLPRPFGLYELQSWDERVGRHGLVRGRQDNCDHRRGRRKRCRHSPAFGVAGEHQPHHHHGRNRQGFVGERAHGLQAQGQHDAREHRLGNGHRNRLYKRAEPRPQAGRHHHHPDQDEGPDRRREASIRGCRAGEQCSSGRRPCERDRHPISQGQERDPDRQHQAQCEQPRGGLLGRRTDRPQSGEHHGKRAGETDKCGDDTGDHRLSVGHACLSIRWGLGRPIVGCAALRGRSPWPDRGMGYQWIHARR